MNQKKARLLNKFVTKSKEKFPYLSYRRVKGYYNHLNRIAKYRFTQEMRMFLRGMKIKVKKEELGLRGGDYGRR